MAGRSPPCTMRASRRSAAVLASVSPSATAMISRLPVIAGLPDRPPPSAVAGEELIGLFRPLAAGRVGGKALPTRMAPRVDERLHHAPAGLDAVGALEQDRVTDHAVIDQGLITSARRNLEIILVFESHAHARKRNRRS